MASPAEDRSGNSRMPLGRDEESTKGAETAAGRTLDQIEQSATPARDRVVEDLHKLSEDVANIKDTVAEIARIVGSQVGEPATHLTREIASTAKKKVVITMVVALIGAILLLLGFIFGVEGLHEWLKSRYGSLPAFVILCGVWTVLGIVILGLALSFSNLSRRTHREK